MRNRFAYLYALFSEAMGKVIWLSLRRISSSRLRSGVLAALTLFASTHLEVRADHYAGASITYNCVGPNQYQITLDLYLDCAGAAITPQNLSFTNNCGTSFTLNGVPMILQEEVSQLCGSQLANSSCNGGPLPGVMHYQFQTTLLLTPCNSWNISWSICCRNTTQNVQLTPGMYVNATLNNAGGLCDDSPQFGDESIPYVCVNEPVSYNPQVTDADGNTLTYAFISARYAAPVPTNVSYMGGFTAGTPIPGITLDPGTGQINFTPTAIGNYIVVVQVTSYDAMGNVIGTVMRDFLFTTWDQRHLTMV
jgi:large repetitive protein